MGKCFSYCAIAFALAAVTVDTASAKVMDLGELPGAEVVGAGGVLTKKNTVDYFTFSIPTADNLAFNIAFLFQGTNIVGLKSTLFSGALGSGVQVGVPIAGGNEFDYSNLAAGNYYAKVDATSILGAGGAYSLGLLLSPQAAVAPGPAGFLVFGAGAGALAYRRRRMKMGVLKLASV